MGKIGLFHLISPPPPKQNTPQKFGIFQKFGSRHRLFLSNPLENFIHRGDVDIKWNGPFHVRICIKQYERMWFLISGSFYCYFIIEVVLGGSCFSLPRCSLWCCTFQVHILSDSLASLTISPRPQYFRVACFLKKCQNNSL